MKELRIITKDRILEMRENRKGFTLVEVLSRVAFDEGHIPGAFNIPLASLKEDAPRLLPNKDETIVVYCSGYACQSSTKAARTLMEMGYRDVHDYKGGKQDWDGAGLPLATD